jgi:nicotinic acid mononucleotide adenylyltransferase
MEFVRGNVTEVSRVAILPGSFHPPTVAHFGLARVALERVDAVVFTMPRTFPHKRYEGVGQAERLEMLLRLAAPEPRFAVAVSEGGLFVEMARELRTLSPDLREVFLVCGRDAAERIVAWPYTEGDSIERQLAEYSLLVAARRGVFVPPAGLRERVETMEASWDDVSSTRVREAIAAGEDWRALVPEAIHGMVEMLYLR